MSVWEYKVISSGKGGFATPALLEKFLGDLGRDEWEIIQYAVAPDNPLAFTGLARRPTQRDWTLQDAAAAAAKAEAEKLRAEFEAKFKAATSNQPQAAAGPDEKGQEFLAEEKLGADDGLRRMRDTSHDDDPDAPEEEKDEWDKLTAKEEEELPSFFDAMKPHMRRNQRGPGMSVGVDYLAKKWDFSEDDIKGALVECGFVMPEDEDSKPAFLEYDGDLYWVNINRRGELWINTKEKPRQIFKAVKGTPVATPEEPAREAGGGRPEAGDKSPGATAPAEGEAPVAEAPAGPAEPLPAGAELLAKIRPMMRRNRRGPGGSGSTSFLSRALKCSEADLIAGFATLGLAMPANQNDKPAYVEIGTDLWWLNKDSRGGVWINGREKKDGEVIAPAPAGETPAPAAPAATDVPVAVPAPAPADAAPTPVEVAAPAPAPAPEVAPAAPSAATPAPSTAVLVTLRASMKETRTGALAGKIERLAEGLGQTAEQLLAALAATGLAVPEKPREKPVFVPVDAEIFWLNRNAKDELWLNCKASKFADKEDDETPEGGAEEPKDEKPRGSRLMRGGRRSSGSASDRRD
ncbi:MAG: hypothetical protein HZA93_30225 [Verrucomicrobia bacterium]|nr:hypothetical protein [Verrucomicrobiota bacterium]